MMNGTFATATSREAVWACAVGVVLAIVLWPARAGLHPVRDARARRRLGGLRRCEPEAECVAVLDSLAAVLRAGAPTSTALDLVVSPYADSDTHSSAGWRHLRARARAGEDLAQAWRDVGTSWRMPGCADIAAAWEMSARHGCPLADAVAGAAADLRARRSHARALDAATAGAKATMGVLVLLPVLGVALASLLGVDVFEIYAGRSGLVTLWPGLALLWLGSAWSRRMIASALRPPGVAT